LGAHIHAGSHAGHAHDHAHGHPHERPHGAPSFARVPADGPSAQESRLKWVLALTCAFMLVEAIGGWLAHSLALIADAGHMLTDAAALALSLVAMRVARRPPSPEKTYGWVRMEILAALVNGAALLVISGLIVWEAAQRLLEPVSVDGPLLLGVAGAGLVVNLIAVWLLHDHSHGNLNVRGAYLHVLGDLFGSVGALVAGGAILLTGWNPADSIVSVLIALLILASAWRLVREATDVLLEAAPAHIDVAAVRRALEAIPRLEDVHDLHVWTLASGFVALSGHGILEDPTRHREVLDEIRHRLQEFGIEHITFQLEPRPLYQIPVREGGVRQGNGGAA
jgi:cobalt-zinc-cadmium efflux system protein